MTAFQPRLRPTLLTLVMLAILVGLGTWQLQRRVWKTELLATIAERMNAAPVDLPPDIVDSPNWAFRSVHAAGHFATDKALWLYGRTYEGKAGIHLLVPLVRAEGDPILVDRGFVPFDHGSELANFRPTYGPTEVDGIIRPPEPGGLFVPSNQPDRNIWYSVDMSEMSKQIGLPLAPAYIAEKPGGHPHLGLQIPWPAATGGTEGAGIRNEHLNYAIFWFSMAAALVVIYVLSSTRRITLADQR